MRYRSFPVAHLNRSRRAVRQSARLRRGLTLFGGALVLGGLIRLATDDTVAEVATGDLGQGPTLAASSERSAERTQTESPGAAGTAANTNRSERATALDAAIMSMLAEHE